MWSDATDEFPHQVCPTDSIMTLLINTTWNNWERKTPSKQDFCGVYPGCLGQSQYVESKTFWETNLALQ